VIVVWIFFSFMSPLFLSNRNLTNLSNQVAVASLLSLGLVFVLVLRHIDISLAALSAVAGALAARWSVILGWDAVAAVALACLIAMLIPPISAFIMLKSKTPAFIITLGMMFVMQAALLWLLPDTQVIVIAGTPIEVLASSFLPDWLSYVLTALAVMSFGLLRWLRHKERAARGLPSRLLQSTVLPTVALTLGAYLAVILVFNSYRGVPLPVVIVIGCAMALCYVANQTTFGKHVYAIGGNPEAARRAGIHLDMVTVISFAIAGLGAGFAGIVNASRSLGVSAQSTDLTLLLGALAALVIGGVSLFGGRGGIWPVVLGGVLVGSVQNGLQLMSASLPTQLTVQGTVLIIAVVVDASISRHSAAPN